MNNDPKLTWTSPGITSYGSITALTAGGVQCKMQGTADDLAQGISTVDDSLCNE